MDIVPVNKRLVVEKVEDTVTDSGIIISSSTNEQIIKGKVLSLAKDLESLKDIVVVGDIVIFNQQLAMKFKIDNQILYSLKEEDVLNILK